MVRPATPGTVVVLAATIVLVLVSVSSPIIKSIYFLSADITVSVASVSLNGTVKLGVFGYCVEGIGTTAVCVGPQLGYELDSDQVFGNTTSFSLPNSLIKWLTYALIIHPIAAGLAALSLLFGVLSHFREFSMSRVTTWFASIATTISMLAFIFDIILFSVAKSRINSASSDDLGLDANLGKGVWLTLVGFVLLGISGCFFGFGHRCIRNRPSRDEKERMRPRLDPIYASEARKDAEDLEKAQQARRNLGTGASGLPAFPEEEVPLTAVPGQDDRESYESEQIHSVAGVGTGYGRGAAATGTMYDASYPRSTGSEPAPRRQNSENTSSALAEPFISMYNVPNDPNTRGTYSPRPDPYAAGHSEGYRRSFGDHYESQQSPHHADSAAPPSAAPVTFPLPDNRRGIDDAVHSQPFQSYGSRSGSAHHQSPTYPPSVANEMVVPGASYGQAYLGRALPQAALHQPRYAQPAPSNQSSRNVYDTAPILVDRQEGSFYNATQASRNREQQTFSERRYHQNLASDLPLNTNSTEYQSSRTRATAQGPASPTYDIYESYYTDSPQGYMPPVSIPYAPEPTHTPAPTYDTSDPYPTYGGNARR